nr:hypothetical protein [Endozoicomonas sp.]
MGIGVAYNPTSYSDHSPSVSSSIQSSEQSGRFSPYWQKVKALASTVRSSLPDIKFTPNAKSFFLLGTGLACRSIATALPVGLPFTCASFGTALSFGLAGMGNNTSPGNRLVECAEIKNTTTGEKPSASRDFIIENVEAEDGRSYYLVWTEKNDPASHAPGIVSALETDKSLTDALQYLCDSQGDPDTISGQSSENNPFIHEYLPIRGEQLNIENPIIWLKEFISTLKSQHPDMTDSNALLDKIMELATQDDDQCHRAFQLLTGYQLHNPDSTEMKALTQQYPVSIGNSNCTCIAVLEPIESNPPQPAEAKTRHQETLVNGGHKSAALALAGFTLVSTFGTGSAFKTSTYHAVRVRPDIGSPWQRYVNYDSDDSAYFDIGQACNGDIEVRRGWVVGEGGDRQIYSGFGKGNNQASNLCDEYCITDNMNIPRYQAAWARKLGDVACGVARWAISDSYNRALGESKYGCKTVNGFELTAGSHDCLEKYARKCEQLKITHNNRSPFCKICNVAKDESIRCNQFVIPTNPTTLLGNTTSTQLLSPAKPTSLPTTPVIPPQHGNSTAQAVGAPAVSAAGGSLAVTGTIAGLTVAGLGTVYCLYSVATGRPINWGCSWLSQAIARARGQSQPVPTEEPAEESETVPHSTAVRYNGADTEVELEPLNQPIKIHIGPDFIGRKDTHKLDFLENEE